MRHSANLNIIIKAIEKASFKTSRDFSELEILQNNPSSAIKFTNACYKRTKEILFEDFAKIRPDFNIVFSDGEEIVNKENAEYSFVIYPIDGLNNLSRALSDCSIAIALIHKNEQGLKESIAVAIYKIVGGELYYCEKGFGAFLNNKKIRTSKRNSGDALLVCLDDLNSFEAVKSTTNANNLVIRNYGCKTLEIGYLASGKIDLCHFKKNNFENLKPFLLLIQEAGGKIIENEDSIFLTNGNF